MAKRISRCRKDDVEYWGMSFVGVGRAEWGGRLRAHTSAVLGTTSARSVISMRPAGAPPMVMSKNTMGLDIFVVQRPVGMRGSAAQGVAMGQVRAAANRERRAGGRAADLRRMRITGGRGIGRRLRGGARTWCCGSARRPRRQLCFPKSKRPVFPLAQKKKISLQYIKICDLLSYPIGP